MNRYVAACFALIALVAAAFVILTVGGGDPRAAYLGAEGGAAALLVANAVTRRRERLGWSLIAASGVLATVADAVLAALYLNHPDVPLPNVSDLVFLAAFACGLAGVLCLLRERLRPLRTPLLLDGVMAGLSLAAVLTVIFLGPVIAGTSGSALRVATGIAYLASDLLLLGVLGVVFGLCAWRVGRAWWLLVGWVLLHVLADGWFSYQQATEAAYDPGPWVVLYPLSWLAAAGAAWQPAQRRVPATETTLLIAMPAVLALADLAVLLWAALTDGAVPALAALLAAAALVVVALRLGMTLVQHQRLLRTTRRDALTDALTGLANRRRLVDDLATAAAQADEGVPTTLLFFDLDGFKAYNDGFGHAAGDALLVRLGRRLAEAVGAEGVAYRPGGDEFCVLVAATGGAATLVGDRARDALTDRQGGLAITTSCGAVALPEETVDADAALQLADARMYAAKRARRARHVVATTAAAAAAVAVS